MSKFATHIIAIVAAFAASMGLANANLITIGGGTATVTCTLSCSAFTLGGSPGAPTGAGTLSSLIGDQYSLANSNEATEAAALNTLIGANLFTGIDGNQIDTFGVSSTTFTTLADYIVLKIAGTHVFLYNTAMSQITIDYLQTGTAGGLSHYTEFGQVPLPAAVWLMAAGIAGLGFAGRKKKART